MSRRTVALTDHQDRLLDRLVASGQYRDADEVLRAGLRLVERQEAEDAARIAALRAAARHGLADLGAGRLRAYGADTELTGDLGALADEVIARTR
jgi:antitoxin ParD1/3/4